MAAAFRWVGGRFYRVGERFVDYIKMVGDDYATVMRLTVTDAKEHKVKACTTVALCGLMGYAYMTNPNQDKFIDALRIWRQKLALLSDETRNSTCARQIEHITLLLNQDQLTFYNCLFGMLIVKDDYPHKSGLYEANCKNIGPKLTDFPMRIVDFGALGKFWYLDRAMKDYDINENEWNSEA